VNPQDYILAHPTFSQAEITSSTKLEFHNSSTCLFSLY